MKTIKLLQKVQYLQQHVSLHGGAIKILSIQLPQV